MKLMELMELMDGFDSTYRYVLVAAPRTPTEHRGPASGQY